MYILNRLVKGGGLQGKYTAKWVIQKHQPFLSSSESLWYQHVSLSLGLSVGVLPALQHPDPNCCNGGYTNDYQSCCSSCSGGGGSWLSLLRLSTSEEAAWKRGFEMRQGPKVLPFYQAAKPITWVPSLSSRFPLPLQLTLLGPFTQTRFNLI